MSTALEQSEGPAEKNPRIVRGRVDSFALYEITDQELDTLENGSPASLQLNFAIFLISMAGSFLVSLLTAKVAQPIFTVFVVVTVIGFLMGLYLGLSWFRSRANVSQVVRKIRGRIPSGSAGDEQAERRQSPERG